MTLRSRIFVGLFLGVVCPLIAFAEEIPLKNWTMPRYSLSGLGKAVDATPPRSFIGLRPCRVIDTRGGPPLGGGIFANSEARDYILSGICGLPYGVDAVSVNFTVTGSPAAPPGAFLLAYPTGSPPSPVVSILNFQAGQTIANAAIVPLNESGQLTINVSHSTHVIMDVNGYFSDTYQSQTPFRLVGPSINPLIEVINDQAGCSANCGISSTVSSAQAVAGVNFGAGNTAVGVFGFAQGASSIGVRGQATGTSGNGVRGEASVQEEWRYSSTGAWPGQGRSLSSSRTPPIPRWRSNMCRWRGRRRGLLPGTREVSARHGNDPRAGDFSNGHG